MFRTESQEFQFRIDDVKQQNQDKLQSLRFRSAALDLLMSQSEAMDAECARTLDQIQEATRDRGECLRLIKNDLGLVLFFQHFLESLCFSPDELTSFRESVRNGYFPSSCQSTRVDFVHRRLFFWHEIVREFACCAFSNCSCAVFLFSSKCSFLMLSSLI